MDKFDEKYQQIIKRKKKPTYESVMELFAIDAQYFLLNSVRCKCSLTYYCEHYYLPQLVADWKTKGGKKSE